MILTKKKKNKTEVDHELQNYILKITHEALRTLVPLGFTLIPLFGLLDYYIVPEELMPTIWAYRGIVTVLLIIQYAIIRKVNRTEFSIGHGYFLSSIISIMIVQMTVDLGGFNSSYYSGINLVMIAVNIMMPWKALHSAVNAIMAISLYVILNSIYGLEFTTTILVNNMYFLLATGVITVAISHVKYNLIAKEFFLRAELQATKDALWGEMEIAKKIQTALLPENRNIGNFEIAANMIPADEVGGDYYDIIETGKGKDFWVTIGDVSGHGVESGLIMMMTQTSIASLIQESRDIQPSDVIASANQIIKENIRRLKVSRYMTITVIKVSNRELRYAGKHQDIIVYRANTKKLEVFETEGTWIGLTDNIKHGLPDKSIKLKKGDLVLTFTDGVTEAFRKDHEMFGQERLMNAFKRAIKKSPAKIVESITQEILEFQHTQYDDITMMVCKVIK